MLLDWPKKMVLSDKSFKLNPPGATPGKHLEGVLEIPAGGVSLLLHSLPLPSFPQHYPLTPLSGEGNLDTNMDGPNSWPSWQHNLALKKNFT